MTADWMRYIYCYIIKLHANCDAPTAHRWQSCFKSVYTESVMLLLKFTIRDVRKCIIRERLTLAIFQILQQNSDKD